MTTLQPHAVEGGGTRSLSQVAVGDPDALRLLRLSSMYPFGGRVLPDSVFGPHFAMFGQVGSGKTVGLTMLGRNVVGPIGWDGQQITRVRSLFMDELGSALFPYITMWLPEDWRIDCHPFSESGVSLHLGRSCTTLEDGWELGNVFAPTTEKSHEFFDEAAKQVIIAVVHVLQMHSKEWGLFDVYMACSDPDLLRHVLMQHPRGRGILRRYFPAKVAASANIFQTIAIRMGQWEYPALLDRRAKHYFTLGGWMNSGAALVLRGSARYPELASKWNAFVFKQVVGRLRNRIGNLPIDETFVFVDEMPEAVLEDYKSAVLMGRSKGVRTAVTTQDPTAFANRFGGRDKANELLGQIGNLCVGRITSPDSAEWMTKFFGKYQYWQEKRGYSYSGGQCTTTVNFDLREEYNVYPYDLQNFPKASLTGGFEVIARTPTIPGWRTMVTPRHIAEMLGELPPDAVHDPRELRREDIASSWGTEDFHRLGLPPYRGRVRQMSARSGGLELP